MTPKLNGRSIFYVFSSPRNFTYVNKQTTYLHISIFQSALFVRQLSNFKFVKFIFKTKITSFVIKIIIFDFKNLKKNLNNEVNFSEELYFFISSRIASIMFVVGWKTNKEKTSLIIISIILHLVLAKIMLFAVKIRHSKLPRERFLSKIDFVINNFTYSC